MNYCENCKKDTQHYLKPIGAFLFDTRYALECNICKLDFWTKTFIKRRKNV